MKESPGRGPGAFCRTGQKGGENHGADRAHSHQCRGLPHCGDILPFDKIPEFHGQVHGTDCRTGQGTAEEVARINTRGLKYWPSGIFIYEKNTCSNFIATNVSI